MLFRHLRKPRWQHPDAEVRREALNAPQAPPAEVVARLARGDSDPEVRCAAVVRLVDLPLLAEIALADTHEDVRAAAANRYQTLLASPVDGGPDRAARLDAVGRADSEPLLRHLALHADEPEIRLQAIGRLADDTVRGDVAVRDPVARVRQAALEAIEDPAVLEEVARLTRHRDQGISKLARERLAGIRDERERQQAAEDLCKLMEALLATPDPLDAEPELRRAEVRWRSLGVQDGSALHERFSRLRSTFLERLQDAAASASASHAARLAAARERRIALCEKIEELLRDLEGRDDLDAATQRMASAALEVTRQAWAEAEPIPDPEGTELEAHFSRVESAVKALIAQFNERKGELEAAQSVVSRAEAALNKGKGLNQAYLKTLERDWQALGPLPEHPQAQELAARFEKAIGGGRDRLQAERSARERALRDLAANTDELEKMLEEGHVERARELRALVQSTLDRLDPNARNRVRGLIPRIHAAGARLRELGDWQQWADAQEKERLCAEVEAFADFPMGPEETVERLRQARAAWKALGHVRPSQERVLWKRFNAACDRAYEPHRPFFEERARQRSENLTHREALCNALEDLLQATDWDAPDWQGLEREVFQTRKVWRDAGPVDRKAMRTISRRYEAALHALEERLEPERQRNRLRKQKLVAEVEALSQAREMGRASREVKRLQRDWHDVGFAGQPDDRQLARSFRKACAAIFKRQSEQQDQRRQEIESQRAALEGLCRELEAAVSDGDSALERTVDRLEHIDTEWQAAAVSLHGGGHTLEARFRHARRNLLRHHGEWQAEQQQRRFEALAEKVALCLSVERTVGQPSPEDQLAEARARWEQLPKLTPADFDEQLEGRFADACSLHASGSPAAAAHNEEDLSANLEARRSLCIQMEVLAGVESPPEAAEARLAYQVARLSQGLSGSFPDATGPDASLAQVSAIEQAWCMAAPVPEADDGELERRFQAARESFYRAFPDRVGEDVGG